MWHPVIDVSESDKDIVIHAELPGVSKDDIEVSVKDGTLTLTGERKSSVDETDKDKTWHRVERSYGRFVRSMILPDNVDPKGISATHKNGVLQVEIPKIAREASEERQRIDIR